LLTLLVDLDGFTPVNALLRLDSALVQRHVLHQLPCLGLLLWPVAGGRRSGDTGGGSIASTFAAQNLGKGFWREKSGLCSTSGRTTKVIGQTHVLSEPTQTWPKFGPRMRRSAQVGLIASHHWGVRSRRSCPVGPIWTRADKMR
jgi:hypothetical protein